MILNVFADADIILDLLSQRDPFYKYSAEIFSLADRGKVRIFTSTLIIANIHYILTKIIGKEKSIKNIQKLKTIVKILAVDEKIITLSLNSDFSDFEDAIQYYTAVENSISYLVTRNIKDYKTADINVMSPDTFLIMLNEGQK